MDYLPITVQMQGRRCLIVGGGEVAARKLKHLLKAQSQVVMLSPCFSTEVKEIALKHADSVALIGETFVPEIIKDFYLVVAATDDKFVNRQVSIAAQKQNIWVNVVDDLELSTFIMPAVIDRSPLLIAVSSSGISPVLARKIREKIEWLLPRNLGSLLERLKDLRPKIKARFERFQDKRRFSEWFIESAINDDSVVSGSTESLFDSYQQRYSRTGKVYLVGAGPGAAELLTVKALKILQKADVVLYDALVSEEILDCIRRDATLIFVGKRSSKHFVAQEKTNQLLVDEAQKGLNVVRLKGGDPMIFGRGGEELEYLTRHQVAYEVVPGITAASGCASYSGIPLTHRNYSQSIHFVTAYEKDEGDRVDWQALAKANQTLVFYMGLAKGTKISNKLIANGLSESTTVAVIEKGTTSEQRVILSRLGELPSAVSTQNIQAPALIIVGEVTALATQLHWFNSGELVDARLQYAQVANSAM
ncbi:siroheme synthase CysG [Aliikangiella maris]|uniref:Siroheme synthase CysG n=2 Tax=Aliikangiella maris TaxID=3162458 RepID=A0ABV3MID0_9GAMM